MSRKHLQHGDIVISIFPFTDLSSLKRRPALVLSENPDQDDVILAFISSKIPNKISKSMLVLDSSEKNFKNSGLKTSSVIRLDKLATIQRKLITRRLGKLSKKCIEAIDNALIHALNIKIIKL